MGKDKKTVVEDVEQVGTPAAQSIQTKSAAMSGILAAMASMSHEQMMQWFPDAMELANQINPGAAEMNAGSIQMKPSDAVGGAMKEETESLFDGESITEDSKFKIVTLIESAVDLRVAVERQALEEDYQVKLVEETVRIQEDMIDKVDKYATYAAEEWVKKNEVAVESAIKLERAEKLFSGIMGLLKECSLDVPDEATDVVATLESRVEELTSALNEQTEKTIEAVTELKARDALDIFKDVAEGLTQIETEKFKKLVEDVDVDGDQEDLRKKITIIREAHFKKAPEPKSANLAEAMVQFEEPEKVITEQAITDPRVARYADAISRASSRYSRGPYTG